MGAAMIFQYDCWSAFKYANDTSQTNETMSFLNTLIMISSNALSLLMAYDIHGNQTESWTTPKTERDGFWETPGSGGNLGFNGGFPSNLTADVTVCKDGSGGCYKTVQEAVNAAPDNQANKKFVVYIKAGVYNEIVRIPLEKKNVVFLGDGMGKTVISGSLTVGPTLSTYNTATVDLDVLYRSSVSNDTLPFGKTKDVRAWMSAAVAYQYDCYGGLSYQGGNSQEVNETKAFLDNLIGLSSNALSMIVSYDLFGNETRSWRPPKTERDGFWEDPKLRGEMGFSGEFPSNLTVDATVCKNVSSGCYKTVQEAVSAAPSDGMGKTVITGSLTVGQPGVNTYESATVGVLGDGFMASGVTFQNAAGPPTHQAVAFRSDSDLSYIENCEFLGNQDTLYAHSLRQFYKSCRIQGNVDFIFGNSAAVFQDCQILVVPRQENPEKGEQNAVTAHGRTDPAQSTGFVFQNCSINGTAEYMALYNATQRFTGITWEGLGRNTQESFT
ncbi:hypothetical protein GH714_021346 [Hevea brasiliensis]|uniref:Pectinesterase catalytic domain-containing protein n=1 Tax=Hevea brasiliensis TaxID=3981 RepID=A0A6A6K8F6_HEVBR|nr:hypothetical protein GH714_021346 [Hevea brasiliensis]